MYPQRELIRLAAHKAAVRRRIADHRAECAEAAARVAQPLAWLDRALAFWRRVSPLALIAAVPLGFLIKRTASPRLKLFGMLMKWGPMVFGAARSIGAAVKARSASPRS
jgi:hypothetical protein